MAKEYYYEGKGCKCAAYYSGECACGADWTPKPIHDALEETGCPSMEELVKEFLRMKNLLDKGN